MMLHQLLLLLVPSRWRSAPPWWKKKMINYAICQFVAEQIPCSTWNIAPWLLHSRRNHRCSCTSPVPQRRPERSLSPASLAPDPSRNYSKPKQVLDDNDDDDDNFFEVFFLLPSITSKPEEEEEKNFRGKELLLIQSIAVINWCQKSFPNFAISKTSKQNTTETSKERREKNSMPLRLSITTPIHSLLMQNHRRHNRNRTGGTTGTTELTTQQRQQMNTVPTPPATSKTLRLSPPPSTSSNFHHFWRRNKCSSTPEEAQQQSDSSARLQQHRFKPENRSKKNAKLRTSALLHRRRRRRIPRAAHHSSFFFSGLLPSNGTTKAFVKENLFTWK